MRSPCFESWRFVVALFSPLLLGACAGPMETTDFGRAETIRPRAELLIFEGSQGEAMTWAELMERIDASDVIVVGEQHDDAVGHKVQLAIVEDVASRWPDSALAMEMIDRSEQATVDDYLIDLIERQTFYEKTAATRWRTLATEYFDGTINRREFQRRILRIGWPEWEFNYQPIVDAAKDGGMSVVGANAPWARYSRLIAADGYEGLDEMTPAQRRLIDLADVPADGGYRERFWDVMVGRAEGEEPEESEAPEGSLSAAEQHMELSDDDVARSFYAQMMYDATMAASIVAARASGAEKVVHLVGQFHSDFEGGTIMEIRRRAPDVRVLSISMQTVDAASLREDDVDRADIVIYTGEK